MFPNISNQDGRGTLSAHASGVIFDFEDPLSPSGPLANSLLTEKDFEIPSDSLEFHLADGTPIKEKEALSQIGKPTFSFKISPLEGVHLKVS